MKLQKIPPGFLDLMDLKTDGGNPPLFSDELRGVVDLTDMYSADKLITGQWNGSAGAVSRTYTILGTLPVLQLARLRAVGGGFTMGAAAGTFLRLTLGIRIASTTFAPPPTVPLFFESYVPPIAAITHYVGGYLSRPLVVQPGSELVLISRGDAAGVDHIPSVLALFEALE
jgi:hypothetical protein